MSVTSSPTSWETSAAAPSHVLEQMRPETSHQTASLPAPVPSIAAPVPSLPLRSVRPPRRPPRQGRSVTLRTRGTDQYIQDYIPAEWVRRDQETQIIDPDAPCTHNNYQFALDMNHYLYTQRKVAALSVAARTIQIGWRLLSSRQLCPTESSLSNQSIASDIKVIAFLLALKYELGIRVKMSKRERDAEAQFTAILDYDLSFPTIYEFTDMFLSRIPAAVSVPPLVRANTLRFAVLVSLMPNVYRWHANVVARAVIQVVAGIRPEEIQLSSDLLSTWPRGHIVADPRASLPDCLEAVRGIFYSGPNSVAAYMKRGIDLLEVK